MLNRKERRAIQFGQFSITRKNYQWIPHYLDFNGIQRDIEEAVDSELDNLEEIDYVAWQGQSIISEDII